MARPDLKTVHMLKKSPKLQVVNVQGYAHYTLPMLTNKKPYNDNNVRLALKYAIDREIELSEFCEVMAY